MIEKLKSTLSAIRNEREEELQRYKLCCGNDLALYEDRKAILTLELPFKTDSASVLYARAGAYQKLERARDDLLRIVGEYEIKSGENKIGVQKRIVKGAKNAHTIIEEWISSADAATGQGRRTLYYILKTWITNFYVPRPSCKRVLASTPSSLSAEDLPHILTLKVMSAIINGLDVEPSTKEVYLSHARSLRTFLEKTYPISPVLRARRSLLSLQDAAKLFEYLEIRALKSTTTRAYHDILLCRALFYAPLPEKKLFSLGAPDEKLSCLLSGDDVFYLPHSFIRLWKEFSCSESLFTRSFDDRQLHKKIQRLGKYAELAIESLTPSILRITAKSVYSFHLSLSDDVVALLPKRS